jgi:hypothetical protein
MKKVNLKGKLSLGKEAISKFEMENLVGGAPASQQSNCVLCTPTGLCTAAKYCTSPLSRCEWLSCGC